MTAIGENQEAECVGNPYHSPVLSRLTVCVACIMTAPAAFKTAVRRAIIDYNAATGNLTAEIRRLEKCGTHCTPAGAA